MCTKTYINIKNEILGMIIEHGVEKEVAILAVAGNDEEMLEALEKDDSFQKKCSMNEAIFNALLQSDLNKIRIENQKRGISIENRYMQDIRRKVMQPIGIPIIPVPKIEDK